MSAIDEAKEAVYGEREHHYGHPQKNHARTANLWAEYLRVKYQMLVPLDEEDVCFLNVLQKMSRDMNEKKHDNLVDMIGYVENVYRIRSGE